MSDALDALDYYDLLQLDPAAPSDAIRGNFHDFARRYHPDRFVDATPEKRARAAQIYRRGTEAYRVLTDPIERARYDAGLQRGERRLTAPVSELERARSQDPLAVSSYRARPFVEQAKAARAAGDLRAALLHAKVALGHEPGHAGLTALCAQLESALARR